MMQALSEIPDNAVYSPDMPQGRPAKRQRSPFGQRLFSLREARGISQAQVAEHLGISQSTYSDWERSNVSIQPERLVQLARFLGTSVGELVGENQAPKTGLPGGRIGHMIEDLIGLPRRQQAKILDTVETLLAGQAAKAS